MKKLFAIVAVMGALIHRRFCILHELYLYCFGDWSCILH